MSHLSLSSTHAESSCELTNHIIVKKTDCHIVKPSALIFAACVFSCRSPRSLFGSNDVSKRRRDDTTACMRPSCLFWRWSVPARRAAPSPRRVAPSRVLRHCRTRYRARRNSWRQIAWRVPFLCLYHSIGIYSRDIQRRYLSSFSANFSGSAYLWATKYTSNRTWYLTSFHWLCWLCFSFAIVRSRRDKPISLNCSSLQFIFFPGHVGRRKMNST